MKKRIATDKIFGNDAERLYQQYLQQCEGKAQTWVIRGTLDALMRALFFGGSLGCRRLDDLMLTGPAIEAAWGVWFTDVSARAENGIPATPIVRKLTEAMVAHCGSVPETEKFRMCEKGAIFAGMFPFISQLLLEKIRDGEFPVTGRLLEHYAQPSDIETCKSMMPYDLPAAIRIVRFIGSEANARLMENMLAPIAERKRPEVLANLSDLASLFSIIPGSLIKKLGKHWLSRKGLSSKLFFQAILMSTNKDQKRRYAALKYFVAVKPPERSFRLGATTVIPDTVCGAELCKLLGLLGAYIDNPELILGVPSEDAMKVRTIELLLGSNAGLYQDGLKARDVLVAKIESGKIEARSVTIL